MAVIKIAHVNKGTLCQFNPGFLMLMIVVIKLHAPKRLLIPAKWREKITRSTEPPLWDWTPDKG